MRTLSRLVPFALLGHGTVCVCLSLTHPQIPLLFPSGMFIAAASCVLIAEDARRVDG